jgi:sporulation inhibitor KapD
METRVYGILHGVLEDRRIIAIKKRHKVDFYYMSKGMFKNFMMYFTEGMYVFLSVKKNPRSYRGYKVQNVVNIEKVLSPNKNNPKVYYDISIIKSGIKRIVNMNRNQLFIDFEMSMPPYKDYQTFESEIIQVGYVLVDNLGNIIEKYSNYIKPVKFPVISPRTIKFLHITQEEIETGIEYKDFYNKLKDIEFKYEPVVYIWGKNDQLELNKMNKRHNLYNFTKNMQFVDLLNLHKTYFSLKNDIGLFNAYNIYSEIDLSDQKHDALEDAVVTHKIFEYFKDVCNNNKIIDFEKK